MGGELELQFVRRMLGCSVIRTDFPGDAVLILRLACLNDC